MAKIIKADGDIISIGTDEGGIKEVRTQDINFVPQVGDEVEIFETENNLIVTKKEPKKIIIWVILESISMLVIIKRRLNLCMLQIIQRL